jgi:hypothetical protein
VRSGRGGHPFWDGDTMTDPADNQMTHQPPVGRPDQPEATPPGQHATRPASRQITANGTPPRDSHCVDVEVIPPGPDLRGCAGPVASSAVDLLAQTRRGRHVALPAGISGRPAGASCRTGHRGRRRRCSRCVGRCVLWWDRGVPTDFAAGLLSKCCPELACVGAWRLAVGRSRRSAELSPAPPRCCGFALKPWRVVALLG